MKWQTQDTMPISEEIIVRLADGRSVIGWYQGNFRVFIQGSIQPYDSDLITGWLPLSAVCEAFALLGELHEALEFSRTRTKPVYAYEYLFGKKSAPNKHAALISLDEFVAPAMVEYELHE